MPDPRQALSFAIDRVKEEEAKRAKLQAAQSRARDELADLDRRLLDASTAHAMATREAPRRRALAYMTDGEVQEKELPDEASQAVLDNLKALHARHAELAATLDSEMVDCQRRIELAQKSVTAHMAHVIEASPEFRTLLENVSAAWLNLRTLKIALDSIVKSCRGNLSEEVYRTVNRSEPLIRDIVGYPWDEPFVARWEQAVEQLATDADAKLPTNS